MEIELPGYYELNDDIYGNLIVRSADVIVDGCDHNIFGYVLFLKGGTLKNCTVVISTLDKFYYYSTNKCAMVYAEEGIMNIYNCDVKSGMKLDEYLSCKYDRNYNQDKKLTINGKNVFIPEHMASLTFKNSLDDTPIYELFGENI